MYVPMVLAVTYGEPPLPILGRETTHCSRHLKGFGKTARPMVEIDKQRFPASLASGSTLGGHHEGFSHARISRKRLGPSVRTKQR